MWIINLLIALVSGAAGGNLAGNLLKDYNLARPDRQFHRWDCRRGAWK
jgi:hypothetical protein